MMEIEIRSLAETPFDDVANAFLEAFADYGLTLDKVSLAAMLKRRGARMDLSFAAFSGGRIVSFIINGVGMYDGVMMAYDTGTGTIKEYRRQGLTDRIFANAQTRLADAGVGCYLLEVLTDNAPAVKIYTRQGFGIEREFDCFSASRQDVVDRLSRKANADIRISEATVDDICRYAPDFFDFSPSWQNTLQSVRRNPEAFVCFMASVDGEVAGIGVSETAYGDITLLAVDKARRRHGIGSRLLLELAGASLLQSVKALNVESSCVGMKEFLLTSGFSLSCRQYEMRKRLDTPIR